MSLATALLTPILGDASPWTPQRLFVLGEAGGVYDPAQLTAEKVAWRRNLLTFTEFPNGVTDAPTRGGLISATTLTGYQGAIAFGHDGTTTSFAYKEPTATGTLTLSVIVEMTDGNAPSFGNATITNAANSFGLIVRNLQTSPLNYVVTPLGGSLYRVSVTLTATGANANTGVVKYNTNDSRTFKVTAYQIELNPTATAYQRITDFTSDFLAAFPTHSLYQNVAGTTPVTALGQPVALAIDTKTGGLANLGPELVTNGDFSSGTTGWSLSNPFGGSQAVSGGVLTVTRGGGVTYTTGTITTVIGRTYLLTLDVVGFTSNPVARISTSIGGTQIADVTYTTTGRKQLIFVATATTTYIGLYATGTTNDTSSWDNISVREVPGVHAIQASDPSRPLLDARVNLLTRTEEFNDAAWSKTRSSVTANAAVAPDGTTTADKLIASTDNNTHFVFATASLAATGYRQSIFAKAVEYSGLRVLWTEGLNERVEFDLAAGTVSYQDSGVSGFIEPAGNGWYRCTFAKTNTSTGSSPQFNVGQNGTTFSFAGDGTSGILIWGADLRLAADAAYPYQRVTTATDYADVGVPRSFLFDGIDDSLYTASNMDLSGTDKVTVLAGVRKLSEATVGALTELSANAGSNNGSFVVYAPTSPLGTIGYEFGARGTINRDAQASGFLSPNTSVLTGLADIVADTTVLRVNGIVRDTDTGDLGTGNFGSYVLFIGRRNNASLPFNGKLYQLVVRGALTDAATLAQAERYVGARTGVFL